MRIPAAAAFPPGAPLPGGERAGGDENREPSKPNPADRRRLDLKQLQELTRLRQRDREVRAHEMAHLAAAGPYAVGGPTYEYRKGPDGQRYAVGGHVNIDTSPVPGDPEATLRKAETIRRAALAPGDPSPQDRSVAAAAASMATKAQIELQQKTAERDSRGRTDAYRDAHSTTKEGTRIDLYG